MVGAEPGPDQGSGNGRFAMNRGGTHIIFNAEVNFLKCGEGKTTEGQEDGLAGSRDAFGDWWAAGDNVQPEMELGVKGV